MNVTSVGDLAQSFAIRRQSAAIKKQLGRLTVELASGQAQDIVKHLSGNMDRISHVDGGLKLADSYAFATREALSDMRVMQVSLSRLSGLGDELAAAAALAGNARDDSTIATMAASARRNLGGIVSALNTGNGGRTLFAGADTQGTAIASSDSILAAARAEVTGATTAADVFAALQSMFHDTGGIFDASIYQGNTTDQLRYHLGGGESVSLDVRADDNAVRVLMKNTVLAALADDPGLPLDATERQKMAQTAATGLLQNAKGQAGLSAGLGVAEAHVEQAASRIEAETTSLLITRNELLGIDPFEVAAQLEKVQFQLESIFTVTARSARLSLVNFL